MVAPFTLRFDALWQDAFSHDALVALSPFLSVLASSLWSFLIVFPCQPIRSFFWPALPYFISCFPRPLLPLSFHLHYHHLCASSLSPSLSNRHWLSVCSVSSSLVLCLYSPSSAVHHSLIQSQSFLYDCYLVLQLYFLIFASEQCNLTDREPKKRFFFFAFLSCGFVPFFFSASLSTWSWWRQERRRDTGRKRKDNKEEKRRERDGERERTGRMKIKDGRGRGTKAKRRATSEEEKNEGEKNGKRKWRSKEREEWREKQEEEQKQKGKEEDRKEERKKGREELRRKKKNCKRNRRAGEPEEANREDSRRREEAGKQAKRRWIVKQRKAWEGGSKRGRETKQGDERRRGKGGEVDDEEESAGGGRRVEKGENRKKIKKMAQDEERKKRRWWKGKIRRKERRKKRRKRKEEKKREGGRRKRRGKQERRRKKRKDTNRLKNVYQMKKREKGQEKINEEAKWLQICCGLNHLLVWVSQDKGNDKEQRERTGNKQRQQHFIDWCWQRKRQRKDAARNWHSQAIQQSNSRRTSTKYSLNSRKRKNLRNVLKGAPAKESEGRATEKWQEKSDKRYGCGWSLGNRRNSEGDHARKQCSWPLDSTQRWRWMRATTTRSFPRCPSSQNTRGRSNLPSSQ